jgi:AcrR family transcriptional regulator
MSAARSPARAAPTTRATTDPRKRKLLEAAFGVFTRYGFRKTAMDEVARAADLSRQGLYLHYPTKEALFTATVAHALASSLERATARLHDASVPLAERLVGALDEWVGRYVGMFAADAADLVEASKSLLGPALAEHEAAFTEALTKLMRTSGLAAAYKPAGLSARQLAETLQATARGWKYGSGTRADFVAGVTIAVRALCAPLGGAA